MHPSARIRNFSIIAHIDHGKTTLADRILELTGAADRSARCTSRSSTTWTSSASAASRSRPAPSRSTTRRRTGRTYVLNLIDTPGHVDFTYEVSRSLAACEGARPRRRRRRRASRRRRSPTPTSRSTTTSRSSRSSTRSTCPRAEPDEAARGDRAGHRHPGAATPSSTSAQDRASASTSCSSGSSRDIPPPQGDPDGAAAGPDLRLLVRRLPRRRPASSASSTARSEPATKIRFMGDRTRSTRSTELGIFTPEAAGRSTSSTVGEVGYVIANIKDLARCHEIGDTITDADRPAAEPLPGLPGRQADGLRRPLPDRRRTTTTNLRDALEKLRLNDASFTFEPETSTALGFGFRCGFLGLLHMEIIQERLEREFDLDAHHDRPDASRYRVTDDARRGRRDRRTRRSCPTRSASSAIEEPLHPGDDHHAATSTSAAIMQLCRGAPRHAGHDSSTSARSRVILDVRAPAGRGRLRLLRQAEVGLARLRLDRLRVHRLPRRRPRQARHPGQRRAGRRPVAHRPPRQGRRRGRKLLVEKLKEMIPRQHVRGRHPGGDRRRRSSPARRSRRSARTSPPSATAATSRRKRKLLEKQKEGKKRMKQVGTRRDPAGGLPGGAEGRGLRRAPCAAGERENPASDGAHGFRSQDRSGRPRWPSAGTARTGPRSRRRAAEPGLGDGARAPGLARPRCP